MAECAPVRLCPSADLHEGGLAVAFDVLDHGEPCRAFAVRWGGAVHAYLNRCSHVPMEMDQQPNRFFDASGQWLVCATHGALYDPASGRCLMGRCRGPLTAVPVAEQDGWVVWLPNPRFQPASPP